MLGGGARSIRSFHSHTQKSSQIGLFHRTTSPRFTRLSVRSLIASLFATSHPQSHSSVLKMSVAQFFPFLKKWIKVKNTHRLSEHAEWSRSLMALHLQVGRGRMIPISPQECCQRGASSQENGREVNCRRDFNEGFSTELDCK